MLKALILDSGKCTGCLQCEMACSFEKLGIFNPARSRIKVFEFGHGQVSAPYACSQCPEAWCARSCPTGALTRNPATGAVDVADAACVGCRICTQACPYGTINYNADTGKVIKCDLCGGDPACARACPTGAILFGEPPAAQAA